MNPASNLILVGPMGAGKTSIGKRLAERFGLRFVDLDHAIESTTGVKIATIFDCEGEAGFRDREAAVLADVLQQPNQLLATGGGAVLREENRRRMRERGFVLHLHVDVPTQLERLARDRSRPLLQTPDREKRLLAMATERAPLYAEVADLRFEGSGLAVQQAVELLIPLIRQHWQPAGAAA